MEAKENKMLALLNIQQGEGRLVALVLFYAILLYIGNVLARTASYALFVSVFNAQTLPYVYIGIAIFGPIITLAYLRMNQRYSLSTVLVSVHILLLLTLAGYWIGLESLDADWVYFSLPIYFGVINSLTISSFWNLLGRIYNLQQGKRLFGLLSSGEHIATVLTGLLAPVLIGWMGTANLYLMAAVVMVPTLGVLWYIIQNNAEKMADPTEANDQTSRGEKSTGLWKDHYIQLIFGLFALFMVGIYFTDNIFYTQAQIRYPTEDELGSFIGVFFGVLGGLSLVIQFFVAGRLLSRFGVRAMILATPLGVLLLMGIYAILGTFNPLSAALFWLAAAGNMYRLILDAVDSAAVNLMYQPLPARLRTQAQTTVMGIIYPLSIGLAGVLLLLLIDVFSFDPVKVSYVLLVIVGIWLFTGVRLGRAYPERLKEALRKRILGGISIPKLDQSSLTVFQQGLESPYPGVVLYSMEMIETLAPEMLVDILPGLLEHPHSEVRRAALNRFAQHKMVTKLDAVRAILQEETDQDLRATALDTLAILGNTQEVETLLESYLEDTSLLVQRVALTGLLHLGGPEAAEEALRKLSQRAQSEVSEERTLAAQVVGDAAAPSMQPLLEKLLQDPDVVVQRAALHAAGHAKYIDLWPRIIAAVEVRETRSAAAASLIEGGESTLLAIKSAFANPATHPQILINLGRVLARIQSPSTIKLHWNQLGHPVEQVCWENLNHPDDAVRARLLAALSKRNFWATDEQKPVIEAQIQYEINRAAGVIATLAHIDKGDLVLLLKTALERKLTLLQTNLYYLLSFLYEPSTILMAWRVLCFEAGDTRERKAYAVETLDILLDVTMKNRLWPFLDDLPLQKRWQQIRGAFPHKSLYLNEWLEVLITQGIGSLDEWIRVCALFTAGKLPMPGIALFKTMGDLMQKEALPSLERETIAASLSKLDEHLLEEYLNEVNLPGLREQIEAARLGYSEHNGHSVLSTVEKVDILGRVDIFSETPAEVLVDVASLLVEQEYEPERAVIQKGATGDCMYIVISGQVRVHDRDLTINTLGAGQIFGEMALLETAPRMASITTLEHTHLLRLDQDPFYELMDGRIEIVRGLIKVLSRRVRQSVTELVQQGSVSPPPELPVAPHRGGMEAEFPLSLAEKVLVLKTVELFKETPDAVLYPIASLLTDIELAAGESVFEKGDLGDSMYIIFNGEVWVHDGDQTLNRRGEGEVFGEMALLDNEPRLATVTALEDTRLLRLDQDPFFELMEDRIEVGHGVIRVLSGLLRRRVQELAAGR